MVKRTCSKIIALLPLLRAGIFAANFNSCIPRVAWRAAVREIVSCRTERRSLRRSPAPPELGTTHCRRSACRAQS